MLSNNKNSIPVTGASVPSPTKFTKKKQSLSGADVSKVNEEENEKQGQKTLGQTTSTTNASNKAVKTKNTSAVKRNVEEVTNPANKLDKGVPDSGSDGKTSRFGSLTPEEINAQKENFTKKAEDFKKVDKSSETSSGSDTQAGSGLGTNPNGQNGTLNNYGTINNLTALNSFNGNNNGNQQAWSEFGARQPETPPQEITPPPEPPKASEPSSQIPFNRDDYGNAG